MFMVRLHLVSRENCCFIILLFHYNLIIMGNT